jgi:PTS system mannose-specific IID component
VQDSNQPADDGIHPAETESSSSQAHGSGRTALKIFLSSLLIQSSFNYRGMQNLGFTFSLLPLARMLTGDKKRVAALLTRHLQMFNTHPYLSAPIIGSVVRMEEEDKETDKSGAAAVNLKNALMGPYAAIGDSFFWGALKPLAAVFSVLLALQQYLLAPLALLLIYNPAHLWVRIRGFMEGYHRGKEGIYFIRYLELPRLTGWVRWFSLAGLGAIAALSSQSIHAPSLGRGIGLLTPVAFLSLIILFYWGMRNGVSQVMIIYGLVLIIGILSF